MKPWILSFLSQLGYWFIKFYQATLRVQFNISEATKDALITSTRPAVLLLWHDNLFLLPLLSHLRLERAATILISHSRDGEIPARIAEKFQNVQVIRVKARLRHMAVKESIDVLEKNTLLIITPDGPRGPRRVIKQGSLFLATKTNADVFTFSWTASKCWHLSTWDRFSIPLPFARVHVSFNGPVEVNQDYIKQALT